MTALIQIEMQKGLPGRALWPGLRRDSTAILAGPLNHPGPQKARIASE